MANLIYPKYKQALLDGAADTALDTTTVKAVLVDAADYVYADTHEFLASVPAAGRVATSAALATKTITNGTFDAADFTFTAVTGDPAEILIIYTEAATPADTTSRLIAMYDTGVTGLPVTPNGGDINVTVNASGFFSL